MSTQTTIVQKKEQKSTRTHGEGAIFYRIIRRLLLLLSQVELALNPYYHFARLTRGEAIVKVNGNMMCLDLKNDLGISKDLFIFRKREHIVTDYVQTADIIRPGDTVLDIGANIGYYALLESTLVGPQGKIYGLEPVSSNYNMLTRNIELNHIENIRAFNLAAGNKTGVEEIYVASKGNISSFIEREGPTYVRKEKIQVVSIDDFVKEHNIQPSLVRMDVEGYEKEIIKGMVETLKHKPKLLIEVHPLFMDIKELEDMFASIAKNGYTSAIVMYERNQIWMKKDGEVKPSLLWITQKIEGREEALGVGSIKHMTFIELQATLKDRGSVFHVLLS